ADMLRAPWWESSDPSPLRVVNSGGAPIPVSLIRAFHNRDIMFCQGYGLTATSPGCTFLPASEALNKAGSAGRAVAFAEFEIRDASRNVSPNGSTGAIAVRGAKVTDT